MALLWLTFSLLLGFCWCARASDQNASLVLDPCQQLLLKSVDVREAYATEELDLEFRRDNYYRALSSIARLPPKMLSALEKANAQVDMVLNNVAEHVRFQKYRGIPRGVPGASWSDIAGCSYHNVAIVAVNHVDVAHITLHELAHIYDACSGPLWLRFRKGFGISHGREFLESFRKVQWQSGNEYYRKHPEEGFALGVAWYFESEDSRESLKDLFPELHEFVRRHFEE